MVARNRSGSRVCAFKSTKSGVENHVDFNRPFTVLTRNGMRHVGKNFNSSEKGTSMKSHGGLYSTEKGRKRTSQYKPEFIKQMEKHFVTKEQKKLKKKKIVTQKRIPIENQRLNVIFSVSNGDDVKNTVNTVEMMFRDQEKPKVRVTRARRTFHRDRKLVRNPSPQNKSASAPSKILKQKSNFKMKTKIDAMGEAKFTKVLKQEIAKWNSRRVKCSANHELQLTKLSMINELEQMHKKELKNLEAERMAIRVLIANQIRHKSIPKGAKKCKATIFESHSHNLDEYGRMTKVHPSATRSSSHHINPNHDLYAMSANASKAWQSFTSRFSGNRDTMDKVEANEITITSSSLNQEDDANNPQIVEEPIVASDLSLPTIEGNEALVNSEVSAPSTSVMFESSANTNAEDQESINIQVSSSSELSTSHEGTSQSTKEAYESEDGTNKFKLRSGFSDKDYISTNPRDIPLQTEGLLYDFEDFNALEAYFAPFLLYMQEGLLNAKFAGFLLNGITEVASFINEVGTRAIVQYPQHQEAIFEYISVGYSLLERAKYENSLANKKLAELTSSWRLKMQHISLDDLTQSSESTYHVNNKSTEKDDGHSANQSIENEDFSASDSSTRGSSSRRSCKKQSPRSRKSSSPETGSERRARKKKTKSKHSSDSESSSDEDDDKTYRIVLKVLIRAAKSYKIKELGMSANPTERRSKFITWVLDVRNILSSHKKTSGILDQYPSEIQPFPEDIDRAVRALLFSVTTGMAKRLVSTAKTAYLGLLDLKRNYGQTSLFDVHRERKKMMNLSQDSNEKASDFLRRIRRQIHVCCSVGCDDFNEGGENIVNIILQGLNVRNPSYSATIAELKARFRSNPSSITFTDLEGLFFNIDDNSFSDISRKRESANFIVKSDGKSTRDRTKSKCFNCGKLGHFARDCKSTKRSSPSQNKSTNGASKDLSHITCHICKESGHYANKCPKRAKKVTFESAHVMKEEDEHCKMVFETQDTNSMPRGELKPSKLTFEFDPDCLLFDDDSSHSSMPALVARDCASSCSSAENGSISSMPELMDGEMSSYCSSNSSLSDSLNQSLLLDPIDEPLEESELCMMSSNHQRRIDVQAIAFAHGDFYKWLLDSGATSHFTPCLSDLLNPQVLNPPVNIKVADGTLMRATHQGIVEVHFTSDQGTRVNLRLMRVLYVPGLQTRLFSIESFISDGRCSALYEKDFVTLRFPQNITMTINLPHVPPGTYVSRETHDISEALEANENGFLLVIHREPRIDENYIQVTPDGITDTHFIGMVNENILDEEELRQINPMEGGADAPVWIPTDWHERKETRIKKKRMDVELAHEIFGHRSISSLMLGSNANVWDDLELIFSGDSWCDMCRIAIAPRKPRSKNAMVFNNRPLEHIFIDLMPCPGVIRGVKECNSKYFLFIGDPVSKYLDKLNIDSKSAEDTIKALVKWRGEMVKKDFEVFLHIRSDAGSNFTAEEFKLWCSQNHIKLTIAGPKHQEQNGFIESSYKTAGRMARSMLVRAHLPIEFFHLAIDYAILILRVLPAKNLVDEDGNSTTTYQILHGKKPRIQRFKVFGCPVVFKRYQPMHDGDVNTNFRQLQRGSRGIFVGFPKNQAGWLIFVPEKIGGSHLIVSSDVDFDQRFLSGVTGGNKIFKQGQAERNVGKINARHSSPTESTGDITNLAELTISHWGKEQTFDNVHAVNKYQILQPESDSEESKDEDDLYDSDEDNHCPSSSDDNDSNGEHGEISAKNVIPVSSNNNGV